MLIRRTHPFTKETNVLNLDVTDEQIANWKNGMVAQKAFPSLTADEREFMISGIPPGDWDNFLKDEEND